MKNTIQMLMKCLGFGAVLVTGSAPAFALDGCLPTCDERDARMFALAGTGYSTLSGDFMSLSLAVPAGTKGFEVSIFDGDTGGFWDQRPPAGTLIPPVTEFILYADRFADGSILEPVAVWNQAAMVDNGWKLLTIPNNEGVAIANDQRAESPSGNFFYRLVVRNKNPEIPHINAFKVKVGGGATLSLKPQAFSFIGALRNIPQDAEIVYPKKNPEDPEDKTGYPSLTNTTNDGAWTFYFKVPAGAKSVTVWDGDLDFGDYNFAVTNILDTDDPDTPNNILPPWAVTAVVNEGVAVGSRGSTGSPADDFANALFRRSPNINYSVCAPDKTTCFENTNPSGNREWEQFKIDTVRPFDRAKMDYLITAIPAGIWTVNMKGVDLDNLNAYRVQYEIITEPPQCPSPDPCELPPPPPPVLPFLVGDTIWLDTNGNGTQDAGEAGISGVLVNLIDANGTVIGTATTDAEGKYSFQVENGVYTVKVDASNFATGGVLANYTPTVDYSGDNAGDNERSQSVDGDNVLTYDFGYVNFGNVMKCDLSSAQTLTQGGWSNKAHANLLQGKFPVSIGNSQNSVTLTTPDSLQAFLPSGGTSRQLVGKVTNPGNIKNTLAGQTMTATLNYMQWNSLAGATLKSGPYAGKTVVEVVRLANQALGSGASKSVLSNLTNALDTINNNLDDGKVDRGNLVCPSR